MNNQKVLKLILIIIAIFVVGFLVYERFWPQEQKIVLPEKPVTKQEASEEVLEQSEVPADWKTYRNEEFGFSNRYPTDWPLPRRTSIPAGAMIEWFRDYRFFITVVPFYGSLEPGIDPLNPESIQEHQPKADFRETEFTKTLIDGYPALHIRNYPSVKPNYNLVLIHREPAVYEIRSAISEAQFLQILSTFKFLD